MSAEIAILNKLAVALATDSAVTISAGEQEQKTYDTADKLFELSNKNPLGIMIFNGLQFMQAPLQTIIADYRGKCGSFATVKEAAFDFLSFLNEWGADSPTPVFRASLEAIIQPALTQLKARISKKRDELFASSDYASFKERVDMLPHEAIKVFEAALSNAPRSLFVGGGVPRFTTSRRKIIRDIVEEHWSGNDKIVIDKLVNISQKLINGSIPNSNQTGIVISGFGEKDKFPSLFSCTVDGVIFGRLKYSPIDYVDIDRAGDRASVIPFAQKEMVERFLYGLDTDIERQISLWCKEAVPEISNQLLDSLEINDSDKERLRAAARRAEDAFIQDLKKRRFEEVRTSSRTAIEGMVEFMPKPEMARMAEALVNLTSLKKRVSRGMDTVGGPIDVAVISRTEGFIWVKRKHYFASEANPRYGLRVSEEFKSRNG